MKSKRILTGLFAVVMILSVLISPASQTAFAATSPGIIFDCLYFPSQSKLTVTASVANPDTNINTAMFVLDYDKALLTTDASKVTLVSPAAKSGIYYSEGHVGADWYYDEGLEKSSTASPAVTIEFAVKSGTSSDALKNALSVCDDTEYLDSLGGYGVDGGLLLCVSSSEFYNAAQDTATSRFNFSEEAESEKPRLLFDSVYSPSKNELVTTVSIDNPDNEVGAAMFVLKYDSSKLTPKTSDSVSYLGDAKESKTYTNSASGYLGADWYYDTALAASSTPTEAVELAFTVTDGTELDELESALSICSDSSYLSSLGYKDDGGLLICESGTVFFNAARGTAEAVFDYEESQEHPVTYTITVTDGLAEVGEQTVTSAKAGDTVTVTANNPADGYRFKEWQILSGTPSLSSAVSATATFTMPAENVSLKAIYEQIPPDSTTYTISVTDGTAKVGSQTVTSAKAGDTVTISANAPAVGYRFKNWQTLSGTPALASVTSATTTFVMPTENVSLKAIYEFIPVDNTLYNITVTNGTAKVNGNTVTSAKAGDVVTITANAPASGSTFEKWNVTSGKITLANANSSTTTFTMPASNVSIAAKYDTGKGPVYPTGDNSTTLYVASAAIVGAVSIFVLIVLIYRKRAGISPR